MTEAPGPGLAVRSGIVLGWLAAGSARMEVARDNGFPGKQRREIVLAIVSSRSGRCAASPR